MKHTVRATRIFLGGDTGRAREALRRAVEEEKAKDPNVTVSSFDDSSFNGAAIREALGSVSLFGGRNIVVLDSLLDHEEGEEFYLSQSGLDRSANMLFIRETAPKKTLRTLFESIGEVKEFLPKETKKEKNNFVVADAIVAKQKRSAWVEFTELRRLGAAAEELHGMIFWAFKTLYLCKTQTKEEALKAGVHIKNYPRYQYCAKTFSLAELDGRLRELKDMYHKAHQGDADLGIFLEQFLLKL